MSRKSYREDDLFTKLPTTTITNNIIPFFCNPLPLRNGVIGTLSVSSEGSSQLGIIDFLHLVVAYEYNKSPIKQKIIDLIRSKGGKANYYDANGRHLGKGNGDLNDLHNVIKS